MDEDAVRAELATAMGDVADARAERPRPARDEKVLAGWNGLAISAFADAALALDDADAGLAVDALDFVREHLWDDGDLARRYERGDAGVDGFARRKPDPHYLFEGLAALDATDGYYVGDRETDVLAAERAGLDSVFVRRDHNANQALRVEPTHEIESLFELVRLVGR